MVTKKQLDFERNKSRWSQAYIDDLIQNIKREDDDKKI